MTTAELRAKYLSFFESKGHSQYPSGLLIPYDVTGRLDESLLFNGAGMVQFKPFFRGVATPPNKRLTTAQKCVRTGDIESVGDTSHLTFFEMLGNFSFGDYFKKEAIQYSWEFLTSDQWLGLDPNRLSFTVFEEDDEAMTHWSECLSAKGIVPEHRVFRLGEETNYWPAGAFSSGPPGPCGPNSEMFYWVPNDEPAPTGPYTREDYLRDEADGKWLEIWNDVFIQFEWQGQLKNSDRPSDGYQKTGMPELPFRSIDTGMGLERTAAVLAGFRSVYDTDAFTAILNKISEISEQQLGRRTEYGADEKTDTAMRIIADHIRTACFCIADGILPSNTGRGYVLRRLIRRAVLKGQRVLGFNDPFFHAVYPAVAALMGSHYVELVERQGTIIETLRSEEALFRRTLDSGTEILTNRLVNMQSGSVLEGGLAFTLYDTYGFPLEVTKEICEEAGISVDQDGYDAALVEAQARSRGASGMDNVYSGVSLHIQFDTDSPQKTDFLGYQSFEAHSQVIGAVPEFDDQHGFTGRIAVALDSTPFYAESGGQVSDTGTLKGPDFELRVVDMIKQEGVFVHLVELAKASFNIPKDADFETAQAVCNQHLFQAMVEAKIDRSRRLDIMRNHTATHLLHAALRKHLGNHVTQAGSLVSPDHLRFDFTHGRAMSPDELAAVESEVNDQILQALNVVTYADVPIEEAKARGAMALFGEKYGNFVRMVVIEGDGEPAPSVELCGGTHVRTTGQIGTFKIVHEASAASGIRRIEAVTGTGAIRYYHQHLAELEAASKALKTHPSELTASIEKLQESLREERKKREKLAMASGTNQAQIASIGSIELATQEVKDMDPKEAQRIADRLVENHPNRVALVAVVNEGKLTFIGKAGAAAVSAGAHCGQMVKELASLTGGGGGGRPDFATAGGKDLSKLSEALAKVESIVSAMVGA